MQISVTERQTFKRCRRKWDYNSKSRQNIERIVPRAALGLGTMIHEALAKWILNPDGSLPDFFMESSIAALDRAKATYHKQVNAEPSQEEMGPILDSVELGLDMMKNYQKHWTLPLMNGFELVAPEQEVTVPIPNTEDYLEGRLDGIIRDKRGNVFVLEHKTYGSRPSPQSLQYSDQFLGYIWIANQLDLGRVVGVAYDGMWKRKAPPKGSSFPDLFLRTLITRSTEELKEFETFLYMEVEDMKQVARQADMGIPTLYINRPWMGCFDCEFEPLCIAQSRDEDTSFIRQSLFTEREGDLVD